MTAKVITSMSGLLDVIRARRDELNISHELIDDLAGFPAGYTGKLLAPIPVRGISHMSLGGILGALGLGLVVIEDPGQRAKVEGRWRAAETAIEVRTGGCVEFADKRADVVVNEC
jgi:hypothetical protein